MRSFFCITVFILATQLLAKAQLHDSVLVKKLTINGFCLCQTTISGLRNADNDLKEVEVEEMDLAKGCLGEDSRFLAGRGYYSGNQPGIIFQKDKDSDYVSKIRLTKQFKGNLPDGNFVDLSKLVLKDLFKLYPQYTNKWESRGCSDYWKFSNDTISFYVKIDKSKKPQFPIDEAFYLSKPIEAIELIISCRGVRAYDEGYKIMQVKPDPIFFIDSVQTPKSDLANINPDSVAMVTVIKDTTELKKFGPIAKGGLIYIGTKNFAKKHYWRYFTFKSPDYAKIVTSPNDDLLVQYILNSKVLEKNFEGDLASINDKKFVALQIIKKEQLIKEYNISNKEFGVIITTKSK